MNDDLNTRSQKTIDVTSTYIQVLLGLASGIIAAVLAFYSNIIRIEGINLDLLRISLLSFVCSVVAGLFSYTTLISAIEEKDEPIDDRNVRVCVICQIIAFGIGLALVFWSTITIPIPSS